jgi:penicillin-binding protein 1A
MARAMGITGRLREVASLALGTCEVSTMELTSAYAVLANGGILIKPNPVKAVLDRDGNLAWSPRRETRRAVRAETAYLATMMLEGPLIYGTAASVRSEFGFARPAAGKTGTTNDENDAWFVGYTPDLCAGVWVGCDKNRRLGLTGAQAAIPIWARSGAHRYGRSKFSSPDGVLDVWIDAETARAECPG